MLDYRSIERLCARNSKILTSMLDGFLLHYSDRRVRLAGKFVRDLKQYGDIINEMPEEWWNSILGQYIAFILLRKGGLARTFRRHEVVRARSSEERAWFDAQIAHPWRYSFCTIESIPEHDFFKMSDLCTDEKFLLHSPGIARHMDGGEDPISLLLLIGFNGECWQTYGPLMPFNGLYPHDILLVAQQLQPKLRRMEEIPALINRDPMPFFLLWRWGDMAPVVHKRDLLMVNRAEYRNIALETEKLARAFSIEQNAEVIKLDLRRWSGHPHFAQCFYDRKKRHLILRSMTDRSWVQLMNALNDAGVDVGPAPHARGSAGWVIAIRQLFNRDLMATSYDKLFDRPQLPGEQEGLDKLNAFIAEYVDAYNRGVECDIDALARRHHIDPKTVRDLVRGIRERLR